MNKPEVSDELRNAIKKALRVAAGPLRKDAQNFVGSALHRRNRPGKKTGKSTAQTIKVGVRQNKAGVYLILRGSGPLNIWEYAGRRPFKIPTRKRVAIINLQGRIYKFTRRKPLLIPGSTPRPVLQPALERHDTKIRDLVSKEVADTIENLAPQYFEIDNGSTA